MAFRISSDNVFTTLLIAVLFQAFVVSALEGYLFNSVSRLIRLASRYTKLNRAHPHIAQPKHRCPPTKARQWHANKPSHNTFLPLGFRRSILGTRAGNSPFQSCPIFCLTIEQRQTWPDSKPSSLNRNLDNSQDIFIKSPSSTIEPVSLIPICDGPCAAFVSNFTQSASAVCGGTKTPVFAGSTFCKPDFITSHIRQISI